MKPRTCTITSSQRTPDLAFRSWDFWLLASALTLASLALLAGVPLESMTLMPSRVSEGQWWRLFTHPFAHVSWYHFSLDGLGFFLLYRGLQEPCAWKRLLLAVGAGFGSGAFAAINTPSMEWLGLCGLSGAAHGIMAVSGLELATSAEPRTRSRRLGLTCTIAVLTKSAYEFWTGRAFLAFLHFGLMGTPIVASHLGGVLGGLVAFLAMRPLRTEASVGGTQSADPVIHTNQTVMGGRT